MDKKENKALDLGELSDFRSTYSAQYISFCLLPIDQDIKLLATTPIQSLSAFTMEMMR